MTSIMTVPYTAPDEPKSGCQRCVETRYKSYRDVVEQNKLLKFELDQAEYKARRESIKNHYLEDENSSLKTKLSKYNLILEDVVAALDVSVGVAYDLHDDFDGLYFAKLRDDIKEMLNDRHE